MDGLQNTFSTRKYYSLVYKYTKAYLNSNSNVRDFSASIYIYTQQNLEINVLTELKYCV